MLPTALSCALAGIVGLAIGSFLNVVIYRVPAGESVMRPGSHCPRCGAGILGRHNVPVLGWLMLRGRCHACHAAISPRYPLVEALTAALFAAVTGRVLQLHLGPALAAMLYLTAVGIALTFIDLDHRRLPDAIVLPAYPVLTVLLTVATATSAGQPWWSLARAAIGAGACFGFFFAIWFAYPTGIGFGDVKLAGVLGLALGYLSWAAVVVGIFAGFLLGSVAGAAILLSGRGGRKTGLPFGPFMVAGALLAIFVAHPIASAYLHFARS
jgi:leader peptidase (prepilin peptidase)/N-methyltransferase